ncbi:MAG: alpha/beta hydrolase [Rubrivivax sp.]|nr:alpha/beta hydrolase [Rubrivivax sp.]
MTLPRRRRRAPLAERHLAQPPAPSSSEPTAEPDIDVHHAGELRPPHPLLMLMEARAPWEYAALLAASPWLARLPVGDGHPVIVYPGLGASDFSTAALRNFLRDRGYTAYAWKQGFNFGPRGGVLEGCRAQLAHVAARHRERVSLVGWSLGGIYARELAKEQPEHTRCVITLGTPFAGHPRATNAWRFYEMVSGQSVHDHALVEQIKVPPSCPTTSLYSKSDGVVAWQCSINPEHPHTENIEVHASHIGMGMNPLALYAIADRLVQDPAHWKRFDLRGARRWFYKVTGHAPILAALSI